MAKKIMILGASILQLPAIQKAKEMGLKVIAVDWDPNAIGFNEDDVTCELISTVDKEEVYHSAKKHQIDGIMTLASDMPVRTVAYVAEKMELNGISNIAAFKATDKGAMRDCLKENNVPVPKYYIVKSKLDFLKFISCFDNCCIIKPIDNSGSRGIRLIDDFSNAEKLLDAYEYSRINSKSGDVLLEEYMEGPEVSVETICVGGECHVIQITDKLTTGAPGFVEIGHSQPSQLAEETKESIKVITEKANKAIGIINGPSHTEIIVTDEGPKVVEIGARLGGDNITTHLVPLSTGINMVECCIQIALGEAINITKKNEKGSAIRYFNQESGVIASIEGIEEAKLVNGVKAIKIFKKENDTICSIANSSDRIGYVIAQGESASEAMVSCKKALEKIRLTMENR